MADRYDVEVFEDHAGEWRWRMVAKNGNIIGTSGEGYKNKAHAEHMASEFRPATSEPEA